jgi:hypothetical protein
MNSEFGLRLIRREQFHKLTRLLLSCLNEKASEGR